MTGRICSVVISAWACVALMGCAVPEITIETQPDTAVAFFDGQALPLIAKGKALPIPYYGTARVGARMPGDLPGPKRRDEAIDAVLDEPFSPWLFPIDFALEVLTYPFRGDRYATQVSIALPEQAEILPGVAPRDLPAIQARAAAARRER